MSETQADDKPDAVAVGRRPRRGWWQVAIVAALACAVALVVMYRKRERAAAPQPAMPATAVLATVDGESITAGDLHAQIAALPEDYRQVFEYQQHEALENLIGRALLLHEARRLKLGETDAYRAAVAGHAAHPGHEEHVLLDVLLETRVYPGVEVADDEVRRAFADLKDRLPAGASFDEARERLQDRVLERKRYEAVRAYIKQLSAAATITRNEEWIAAQKARAADNPLGRARKTGRPVLAEFGEDTCVPCKAMKPVLAALGRDYAGRVEVVSIDLRQQPHLRHLHAIALIPTQVIFDAAGNERWRHEGFLPREDAAAKIDGLLAGGTR